MDHGQYWQRLDVTESTYLVGPKAQQALNRDIAQCVTELKELERLGAVKNAIPAELNGQVMSADEIKLETWNAPMRDGSLLTEDYDYQDFEGCMFHHGWERVLSVPYQVAISAREDYLKAHVDYDYNEYLKKSYLPNKEESGKIGERKADDFNE